MDDWRLTRTFQSVAGAVRWEMLGAAGGRATTVLLHGTPFSSYVWREVAAALGRDRQVFVWDMPGFGASEQTDGQDVSIGMQTRVFADLLDHWGVDEPDVVAHDIGGAVALRATLIHDVRYRRLVLVDPVAVRPWGSPFFRLVRDHADVFERLPATLHAALVRAYIGEASSPGLRDDVLDRLVEPWLGTAGQAAFYRQIAHADQRFTDEIQHQYGSISVPVLVCWGRDDAWIPWNRGEQLVGMIPTARFELIARAGHLVQEDAPTELIDLIQRFLDEPAPLDPDRDT